MTDREARPNLTSIEGSAEVVVERADAPTAKQVAVIWISEEGVAPEISG